MAQPSGFLTAGVGHVRKSGEEYSIRSAINPDGFRLAKRSTDQRAQAPAIPRGNLQRAEPSKFCAAERDLRHTELRADLQHARAHLGYGDSAADSTIAAIGILS